MITPDGYFDWAERLAGNPTHVNIGRNTIRGLVAHSAEGYETTLLDPDSAYGYHGNLSWHATNLKNGRFIQHFSVFAQTWHASAMNPFMVGLENEGTSENPDAGTHFEALTEDQIANLVRASKDLAALKSYSRFARLTGVDDPAALLLAEHNQTVLFGGSATRCPSGRIPWETILSRLATKPLHVDLVTTGGEIFTIRFSGSGTITINDGDEWPLRSAGAALPDFAYSIEPPGK